MDSYRRGELRFDVVDRGPAGGEAVVLLHGFPQWAASWDRVVPPLVDAGLRALAPDQRGYSPGARPVGRRAYRIEELVGDTIALLDAAGIRRAHVVGHDWGGGVAWSLAMWHPDRLASLTALSTPHPTALLRSLPRSAQLLRSWYIAAVQLPAVPERLLAVGTPAGRDRLVRVLAGAGLAADRARDCVDRLAAPGALTATLNWYRAMPLARPRTPRRVTVPTLYVWGSGDRFVGRAAAEGTAHQVDGPYRLEVLEGAGHWLPDQHPRRVADLIASHVRRNPAGPGG
jgi:pimeloyl-ACP methyl ester carboxylesterase